MPIVRLDTLQQFAAINLRLDQGAVGGPVIVPSCAQIVLYWALTNGQVAHNVLYGRYAGVFAGTPAQATAMLTAMTTGATWAALAAFLAPTTALAGLHIRDVNTEDQAIILNGTPVSGPGTSVGTALPDEVAAVITMTTAKTGPSNRGRTYIPGWASNASGAGGVIAAGAVSALAAWATTNLLGALSSNSYVPVIGQKARAAYTGTTGTAHPARPAGSIAIVSAVVKDNHWDSQRRRGLR